MTSKQFTLFQSEFIQWQMLLQLGEYTVGFKQADLRDTWAQIEVDAAGCVASCTVARKGKWTTRQIKTAAKHDCPEESRKTLIRQPGTTAPRDDF